MYVGDSKTYTADDFSFESGSSSGFVFKLSSSDAEVLSVSGDATVTAKSVGVATLTATDLRGRTAECNVSVVAEIKSFSVRTRSRTRKVGETAKSPCTP